MFPYEKSVNGAELLWLLLVQLREKAWFDSSPRSRGAFAAPHPGHPKSSEASEPPKVDPEQGPLDTFCVLTLEPEEVTLANLNPLMNLTFFISIEICAGVITLNRKVQYQWVAWMEWVVLQIDYYHAKDAVRILFKCSKADNGQRSWSRQEVNPWTSLHPKL